MIILLYIIAGILIFPYLIYSLVFLLVFLWSVIGLSLDIIKDFFTKDW